NGRATTASTRRSAGSSSPAIIRSMRFATTSRPTRSSTSIRIGCSELFVAATKIRIVSTARRASAVSHPFITTRILIRRRLSNNRLRRDFARYGNLALDVDAFVDERIEQRAVVQHRLTQSLG